MAGYCDNFSMIDGGDEFKAFPGLKGDDGTTFYPHVSAEGVLSWTNDGGKPNPDPVNIKGADGKSAYAAAVQAGFTGTEAEFNEYLSGIGDLTEEVAQQKSAIDDIASPTLTGSFYDFSPYINKPLFGASSLFTGAGTSFDIDISDLDLAGKTISTYIWIDAIASYIEGNITEVQLDADDQQIFPTSGFHYVAHPMTILPECKTIRLWASPNAYNAWQTAAVTHAQLYTTGSEQVDFGVRYSIDDMATVESVDSLKSTIGAEEVVTSNTQLDPAPVIGKTFGSVNGSTHLFPFGKTLAELGSGYTNYIMHLNTGSISGYFQLIKEDGTTDNGNQSFNTVIYSLASVVNPNLVRGVKIHCYSAASGISISSFGLTFNGLPLDTFATGIRSNINPKSWSGKKWVAYGDSITQGGLWERIVVKRTGLMLTNAGLGGSCVADVSGYSIASFTDSSRISALPADADVVTIMGGTNDYGGNVPIGDIPTTTPFDKTSFIGALCETVRLIQTQCPDALIVIMSNIGGRGTQGVAGEIPTRNSIGLSSSDYALGAEKAASFMGCPFVDVHRCGITPMNRVKYISDAVHPNEAGAELIARKVVDYLVNNYPN